MNRNQGKLVFKRALRDLLPRAILTRSKMGFSAPLAEWFQTALRKPFEDAVLRPEMARFLDLGEARRLWREQQAGSGGHEHKLWTLFMLANWQAAHLNAPVAETAEAAAV